MSSSIVLSDLPALPIEDRRDLPGTAAIYFVLADDTVPHGRQAVPLDV